MHGQWAKLKQQNNQKQRPPAVRSAHVHLAAAQKSAQLSLEKALSDLRKEFSMGGIAATSSVLSDIVLKRPTAAAATPAELSINIAPKMPAKRPSSAGAIPSSPPYRRPNAPPPHREDAAAFHGAAAVVPPLAIEATLQPSVSTMSLRTTQCASAVAHCSTYRARPKRPLSRPGSAQSTRHQQQQQRQQQPAMMPRAGGLSKSPRPQSAGGLRVGFQVGSPPGQRFGKPVAPSAPPPPAKPPSRPSSASSTGPVSSGTFLAPPPPPPVPVPRPVSAPVSRAARDAARVAHGVPVERTPFAPQEAKEWRQRIWTPRGLPAGRPVWSHEQAATLMRPGATEQHRQAPRLRSDAPAQERVVELQMATTVAASPVQRPASAANRPPRPVSASARPQRPLSAR